MPQPTYSWQYLLSWEKDDRTVGTVQQLRTLRVGWHDSHADARHLRVVYGFPPPEQWVLLLVV